MSLEPKQIARRGPRRWWRYWCEVIYEGAVGIWRSISLLFGIGLVTLFALVLVTGAALAAIFNVAWLIAAAFVALLVAVLIGGYRTWSSAEHRWVDATDQLHAATSAEQEPAIPDAHRVELQEIAAGMETYLVRERPVRYHPPGKDGSAPLATSFRTHFPDLANLLDLWDKLVNQIERSRERMRQYVLAELAKRQITYYGPLAAVVAERIEVDGLDKLEWSESEGQLFITGFAIARLSSGADLEELKRPLNEVLAAARESTEALLLRSDRELIDKARSLVRDQLERIRAMHVIRGRCDLCA